MLVVCILIGRHYSERVFHFILDFFLCNCLSLCSVFGEEGTRLHGNSNGEKKIEKTNRVWRWHKGTKPSNKSTTECRQSRHAFPNRKFSFVSVFMKCAMHRLHRMAQRFRRVCRVCVPQSNCEIWIQFFIVYYLLRSPPMERNLKGETCNWMWSWYPQ